MLPAHVHNCSNSFERGMSKREREWYPSSNQAGISDFKRQLKREHLLDPLGLRTVCVSFRISEYVHIVERVEPSNLKSKKIERLWKAQMCQRSEGSIYRPYHGGRWGGDSNRKLLQKGSQ